MINENKYQITHNDREKVIKIFEEIDIILPQINQNRKRLINIDFLFKKIFTTLKIGIKKESPLSKSKKTISKYESYWDKIQLVIGDKIQ